MKTEMSFWEKWYWVNLLKGTNPVTTFIGGLIEGWWIAIILSLIFCFVTDPQWNSAEGMHGWSFVGYFHYYCYFWQGVWTVTTHYLHVYWDFFWNHMGSIGRFWRHVLFLDHPEYFDNVHDN